MKKSLCLLGSASALIFIFALLGSVQVKAQTVTLVPPGENTITEAVSAAGAEDTLVLARGEEYTITEAVAINIPLHFRSSPGSPDDMPAVIYFTSSTGDGGGLFQAGANCSFTDLGMVGKTTEDKPVQPITISVPNLKVVFDGCVFQDTHEFFSTGANVSMTVKNSKFFNFTWSLYDGWVGQFGGWDSDSVHVEFVNNTVFIIGRYINYSTTKYGGSTFYDHNTVVNNFNNTFFPIPDKEVTITNNLMVNSFFRGYVGDRTFQITADSTVTTSDASSNELGNRPYIPATDTLNGDISLILSPMDSTEERMVKITNNMKFTEQRVLDFHLANTVTTQPILNETAEKVLGPEFGWDIKDNWDGDEGVDPVFAMGAIPEAAFERGFQARLDRISPENESWYDLAWRPDGALVGEFIWPLPFDFTPTADTREYSSDGYPLGDLNWFGQEVVDAYENGEDFPNTGISNRYASNLNLDVYGDRVVYELQQSGRVSLTLFSLTGAEVVSLVNEVQGAGKQSIVLPGNLDNGIYICKLRAGTQVQTKKVVFLK